MRYMLNIPINVEDDITSITLKIRNHTTTYEHGNLKSKVPSLNVAGNHKGRHPNPPDSHDDRICRKIEKKNDGKFKSYNLHKN